MKGDFSRDTFSPRKHYSGVLMQQGRVQLDADWNEQRAIDRYRVETGARDLIGPGGGPVGTAGFEISVSDDGETLIIEPGDYYVDGILCQNEEAVAFEDQADLPGARVIDILEGEPAVGLVYLDVWEQHVSVLDDDHIREVALGGPDTATRSRTVWQAKVLPVEADKSDIHTLQSLLGDRLGIASQLKGGPVDVLSGDSGAPAQTNRRILDLLGVDCDSPFDDELGAANPPSTGRLLARAVPPASAESPCVLPPNAGYQRLENQLYRVEIHREGDRGVATFKWSRDNGSVATAVVSVTPNQTGTEIVVRDLGRDETLGFANGQYVELANDDTELSGQVGTLLRIVNVDPATRTITVDGRLLPVNPQDARDFHYKLRRWDSVGELPLPSQEFADLEGGIQVRFAEGRYSTGDYWLIPARTATGQIEWPENQPQPPSGIAHHYSRLALVMAASVGEGGRQLVVLSDCRRLFPHVTELTSLFYLSGDGQEAGSGRPLPRPLVVGVANGDKPVVGARVKFEVQTTDPAYDGHLDLEPDGDTTNRSVITTTDAQGEARCFWTLATEGPSQQVKASLVDGTHLSVYFNANLSAAGEAVEESIQITGVQLGGQTEQRGQDLRLDGRVPVTALTQGIRVVCDQNSTIDAQTVQGKPTCFVTLRMPFPQTSADRSFWGTALVGFQPLILAADVTAQDNVIFWKPSQAAGPWLETLFEKIESTEVLAHLTLKGNFIWDRERPEAYLDGDIFGRQAAGGAGSELALPSGDGRRGGDFEMWFRLVPQQIILDSVTLDRTEVTGGTQAVMGTVRIVGRAPQGGVSIQLQSNNPGVVSVPGSVTIGVGQSSATFVVNHQAVGTSTPVTITATLAASGGGTQQRSVTLTVQPPVLSSVAVNPPSIIGKTAAVTGTVTLTGPAPAGGGGSPPPSGGPPTSLSAAAPAGGVSVALSSANPSIVNVPASVTVPAGSATAQFTINTEAVSTTTVFQITASSQGVQQTTTLTVQPPAITQLTLNPVSVLGGATPQGTVQLNGPAPAGFAVTLQSANTAIATVQASVTVPANATSVTFPVNALPVTSTSQVNIVASRAGIDRPATLTVQPPVPVGFALSPPTIANNGTSTGTITLSGPAPSGTSIALSGSNATTANFPASVAVSANATQVTFTATGKTFTGANRSVDITASYLGGTRQATLTVQGAIVPSSVTLNPNSVIGKTTAVTGTVVLTGPAPAGGLNVTLSSANPSIAGVPASVTVPAGSTTAQFTVNTQSVSSSTPVTITAASQGVTATATLTVQPPTPSGFSFNPTTITGGQASTGTITLSGPAPSGTSIALSGSNATTANFPASVAVSANATQVTFTATGQSFTGTTNRSVTVTASYLGGTLSATLTVQPTKSKEKDKEKEKETEKATLEKVAAIEKSPETPLTGRSGIQGPGTAEGEPAGTDEESGEPGGAENPAPGRAFVQATERPAPGQQALDQPPEEEEEV